MISVKDSESFTFNVQELTKIPDVKPSVNSLFLKEIRETIDTWLSLNSGIYNSVADTRSLFL